MLGRSITTLELIQLNQMFCSNRGYKDLIRDFRKAFNVDLPKTTAKQFLTNRSWQEVLYWLTGDKIDTKDLDKIPENSPEHYEMLERMLELNKIDEEERQTDLATFNDKEYYIPEDIKYFNMPLYGEIITYKYKEPLLKCFLLDDSRKITKIENVYISDQLPPFLLNIVRKINASVIATKLSEQDIIQHPQYLNMMTYEQAKNNNRSDIFESELFKKYGIVAKR